MIGKSFGSMKRRVTFAVVVLVVIVASFLIALLLHHGFAKVSSRSGDAWSSAIQATSSIVLAIATVVLVAVTFTYVRFTRDLVLLQSDTISPARAQQREDAVHELAALIADYTGLLEGAASTFPIAPDASPDPLIIRGSAEIGDLANRLFRLEASLPSELVDQCRATVAACKLGQQAQNALYESLRVAPNYVERHPVYGSPQREWTWSDVGSAHANLCREARIWTCDWEELISGLYVAQAVATTRSLYEMVTTYLGRDPRLDQDLNSI
jgi:hypothetical protein